MTQRTIGEATAAIEIADFALALRRVRRDAGDISFRKLARMTGYGTASITRLLAGKALPKWPLAEKYLVACGLGGPEIQDWRRRWAELADIINPISTSSSTSTFSAPPPATGSSEHVETRSECPACGAWVANQDRHDEWHAEYMARPTRRLRRLAG